MQQIGMYLSSETFGLHNRLLQLNAEVTRCGDSGSSGEVKMI